MQLNSKPGSVTVKTNLVYGASDNSIMTWEKSLKKSPKVGCTQIKAIWTLSDFFYFFFYKMASLYITVGLKKAFGQKDVPHICTTKNTAQIYMEFQPFFHFILYKFFDNMCHGRVLETTIMDKLQIKVCSEAYNCVELLFRVLMQ